MQKTSTTLLVVMLFSTLGLWGCTHQKNGATNAKIRELEIRHGKLEEDYRIVVAVNESTRKKVSGLETERANLVLQVQELKTVVLERDDLRRQLAARTGERDSAQVQLSQFSKDLQALANRAEAAVANFNSSTLNVIPASRKSE